MSYSKRRRTPEARAHRAAQFRERYASDPEFRQRHRQQNLANYHRNGKGWSSQAPAIVAAKSANKQAEKLGAAGVLTGADIDALWERQPECASCGRGRGVDHIIAFINGGPNVPGNLQNLCPPCNQVKHKWDVAPEQINRPPFDGDERICRRGHLRSEHTYRVPSGSQLCRLCHKASVARYRARQAVAA